MTSRYKLPYEYKLQCNANAAKQAATEGKANTMHSSDLGQT